MKLIRFFLGAVVALAMVLSILVVLQMIFEPVHVVKGSEMYPELEDGDAVFVKSVDTGDIDVNKVIFMRDPENREEIIARRVVGIQASGSALLFTTKADNKPENDNWVVSSGQITGTVGKKFKDVGSFISFISSAGGFLFCVAIPGGAALLLIFMLGIGEGIGRRLNKGSKKK